MLFDMIVATEGRLQVMKGAVQYKDCCEVQRCLMLVDKERKLHALARASELWNELKSTIFMVEVASYK